MHTGKKGLALFLALLMVFSLLPTSAFAADGCLTAKDGAATTYSTTQGGLLNITLSDLFSDSSSHTLTYTLDDGDYGTQTKIADGVLAFTNPTAGTYTPTVTATCSDGATASVKLSITVEKADDGDPAQYNYDETPADSVTVYVTISSDGVPIVGQDGTVLSHLEVTVPYFDLANQDLSDYYRYGTASGSGEYTSENVVKRPTALHLYLYMIGVYYLGYTPEEIMTGAKKVVGASGEGNGVLNMDGEIAYTDTNSALNISGSATSMYMSQFWGHDENLMYYRNHMYPLMSAGWGSTADYILLSDGDTIDVAMFTDWSFYNDGGAFTCFDADDYSVNAGETVTFKTLKYDTSSVADGGSEQFDPVTGMSVAVYDANWKKLATIDPTAENSNSYSYTFEKGGTYYLMARDTKTGENARYAPATAKVTVTKAFDPAEYYKDYDFTSVTLDEAGTQYLYNISESEKYVSHFSNAGEKKVYTVTVPKDTEFVYVNYPADVENGIIEYCALFDADGNVTWEYYAGTHYEYTVTQNDDSSYTIKLPVAFLLQNDLYIALEDGGGGYEYFNCFYFQIGENTPPSDTVSVTGVTISETELTLDRHEKATLTAAVTPEDATKTTVAWKSSDTAVATVTAKGEVTAVSEGTATITVTTADGGFTASCKVTVTDVNKPPAAEDGYYELSTAAQLKWFADEVNNGSASINARLMADIDVSEYCSSASPWTPIGDEQQGRYYSGTFDGQNHAVKGLFIGITDDDSYVNTSTYYKAFFGHCQKATVKNLSVYGTATSVSRYVAGLIGTMQGSTTVENCHNYVEHKNASVSGCLPFGYGGIVADVRSGSIRNCTNHADITGLYGMVGGIAGEVMASSPGVTIENCANYGKITALGWSKVTYGGTGGIVGQAYGTVTLTNCYNLGDVSHVYTTSAASLAVGGLVGSTRETGSMNKVTMTNCYSLGTVSADKADKASVGALFGTTNGNTATVVTAANCWYLDTAAASSGVTEGATAFTAADGLKASALSDAYQDSCPAPVLSYESAKDHTDANADGKCDTCGVTMEVGVAVPTRKADYPAETAATVQTGKAYLLSDLQSGKVFDAAEGQSALDYTNIYYERSADNGATWSAKTAFTGALFGGTTIQITENTAGTYIYRFYASHDGEHFSVDTWTLTLTVEDAPTLNFSFYVGKDYNGNYPIIKLYTVTTDEEGNEVIGDEVENCFVYSNFTTTAPDGVDAYDTSKGILTDNYQMFYANLTAGRYAYRAFGKNTETEAYDVELGGMTLSLPTDTNVDGNKGGGTSIYLRTVSFYTSTKKTDNTYFTADEYHIRLDCPLMSTSAAMGTPYTKGSYAYYPTVVYAAGNACLYNIYAYPDIDGYMFTQTINNTFPTSYSAQTKSITIGTAITLTVNIPQTADFGLYFQWNNFNTTEVEPNGEWTSNTDGTKTNTYTISKSNSNYTWRMSDAAHTTQGGWLASMNASGEKTFTYGENAATNRVSHSFSSLGTATTTRDEADLQVNLDPSGYKTLSGTTRVRAYRYWELINSDTGNIMLEPDFHWNVVSGDASVSTVDGGNASANWADVTAGTQDSVVTVYYDSIDVNPGEYKSHGGLYPATQPHRVGVMVVGGTSVTHGTADAHVAFNMADGATTTRSAEWDYNFDTWYYEKNETDPALTFTVASTGNVTVQYALVSANNAMQTSFTGYVAATQNEDGSWTVPLNGFKNIGNGLGGTVIIRMTDDTGVSYRLVRAAQVTITAENASNPGENIMPGDSVKLTFDGMFRTMNKMSGIFNPTNFKVSYDNTESGETCTGSLNQYQILDNASITFTVPADIEFAEDAETTTLTLTNGYTFGSMYSAANPFGMIYTMTDTGVGTNFNAVSVTYYLSHYADAVVTVYRKVTYDTALVIPDASGTALEGVTVMLTGPDNAAVTADANGRYQLGYGRYSYILTKDGYGAVTGEFSLGSANEANVKDGILTLTLNAMSAVGANAWDGTTMTEPAKDESEVYQIGTAAELAWFANAVNTGSKTISAKLTADIELASKSWTPIGTSANRYTGTFDGDGHIVKNLYINTTAGYQALFGYVGEKATIKNLGVTGIVTTTGQYAAGIVAYLQNYSVIDSCFTDVTVTSAKTAAGIADGQSSYSTIQNCYNLGTITATASGGMAGGIASASGTGYIPTIVNCYNIGKVYASKNSGSLKATAKETTNCYYLEGSCPNETSKPGTVCTAEELKAKAAALGESFVTDTEGVNGGYPILRWQSTAALPTGDANRDGVVDILDAQLVYAYATAGGTLSDAQLLMADMDSDGLVTVKDAAMIYAIIAAASAAASN